MIIGNSNLSENIIGTNPNLLDNWYFVGGGSQQGDGFFPINQRKQTTYNNASGEYCFDRWYSPNSSFITCTLNNNYIQIDYPANAQYANFATYIPGSLTEQLAGKTVTMSLLLAETTTEKVILGFSYNNGFKQAELDFKTKVFNSVRLTLDATATGHLLVFIQNGTKNAVSLKMIAAKLELGTTQTLAHQEKGVWVLNEIPDYATELTKCQRYFQIFRNSSFRKTAKEDFRPVMNDTPALSSISVSGTTYYTATANV